MSSRFCEQCGAALAAQDKFCMNCGNPTGQEGSSQESEEAVPAFLTPQASPAPAAPVFAQPATSYQPEPVSPSVPGGGGGGASMGLILGGALLALIVLGGGGWYAWGLYTKSLGKPPAISGGAGESQPKKTEAAATGSSATTAQQDGESFIGLWAPEQPDSTGEGEEVRIVRQGSLLVGTNESDTSGRLELTPKPGDKLEGFYYESPTDKIPLTAELLDGGKRMAMTLAPPQSEYETVILIRVNEAEKAAALAAQEEIPGIVPISGVDEAYAQKVVAQQPEVKEFIALLAQKGVNPRFEVAEDDPSTWMVRVYEIVDDGDGMSHAATFGWYKVDKKTGAVSPGM